MQDCPEAALLVFISGLVGMLLTVFLQWLNRRR